MAGCEGYGCEPVFALAYVRHVNDNGKDLLLNYVSPFFQDAINAANLPEETKEQIIKQVIDQRSCQHIEQLPQHIRNVFVVSSDITSDEHIHIQAALQSFVDNSLSKTINFPEGTTEEEVSAAFMTAWKLGCKGITVYITGSRDKVVLETNATKEKKEGGSLPTPTLYEGGMETQLTLWKDSKKPRLGRSTVIPIPLRHRLARRLSPSTKMATPNPLRYSSTPPKPARKPPPTPKQ